MMPATLSYEQAPPFPVPLRFFLTAPLFMLLAALLLVVEGPEIMLSRHLPATLAATHLLTLGFTTMVMCGALLQMLPVVAGAPVAAPRLIAWMVYPLLVLGALAVAFSFLSEIVTLMYAGALLTAIALCIFLIATGHALLRSPSRSPSVPAMGYALLALSVTVALGITLVIARYHGLAVPYPALATLHPLWGLVGWTLVLIIGVAYQVVPMFQLTSAYPSAMTSRLTGILFLLLVLRSGFEFLSPTIRDGLSFLVSATLAAGVFWFGAVTLQLQHRRKRKLNDPALMFWRSGLFLLLAAAMLGAGFPLLPPEYRDTASFVLGILTLPGFILALINGMLYKIVPFLAWFHLQANFPGKGIVPNVRQMLPETMTRGQMRLYLAALTTLLLAVGLPHLARPAGILWALNAFWLAWNLLRVARIYKHTVQLATTRL